MIFGQHLLVPPPLAAGGTDFSDLILSYSPAGYWRHGEASGATLVDSSGNGLDGTYNNVTLGQTSLIPSESDTATDYHSSTSYAEVPDDALLDITGDLTIITMMDTTSNDANSPVIAKWGAGFAYILIKVNSVLYFQIRIGATTRTVSATVTPDANLVVATRIGTVMNLYVDNVLVDTLTGVTGSINSIADNLSFGKYSTGTSGGWTGIMDDTAVLASGLTATDVDDLWNASGL